VAYIVYILYSQKSSKYYTGQTDNIIKRLGQHNSGLVKSTKYGLPWDLVFTKTEISRSEALLLEKKIKKRGAKRFLEDNKRHIY
jgi:putative endonuclease